MRILDALGDVLEKKLTVFKIDVVLGIDFIRDVRYRAHTDVLTTYKDKLHVDLYPHDFYRAEHIAELYEQHIVHHHQNMALPVEFFSDTLTVIYEWTGRFKPIYLGRHTQQAYELFHAACHHHRCQSIIQLDDESRRTLFDYIYTRDFIDSAFEYYSKGFFN